MSNSTHFQMKSASHKTIVTYFSHRKFRMAFIIHQNPLYFPNSEEKWLKVTFLWKLWPPKSIFQLIGHWEVATMCRNFQKKPAAATYFSFFLLTLHLELDPNFSGSFTKNFSSLRVLHHAVLLLCLLTTLL